MLNMPLVATKCWFQYKQGDKEGTREMIAVLKLYCKF